MIQKADIIKYAAVIIDNQGRYLIVKDKEDNFWKNVGGKQLPAESPEDCLKREIEEELNVQVSKTPEYYFSCPTTPTASDPTKTVQIILYKVDIIGTPIPTSEVGNIHWLTKGEVHQRKLNLTQQIRDYIVPKLLEDNLLK
jgi:8-oxo-dGTP pyrophosphatase MutT (NUDIX family)